MQHKSNGNKSKQSHSRQLRSAGSIDLQLFDLSPKSIAKKTEKKNDPKEKTKQKAQLSKSNQRPKQQNSEPKSVATRASTNAASTATSIASPGKRRHPAGDLRNLVQNCPPASPNSPSKTTNSPSSRKSAASHSKSLKSPVVHSVTVTERKVKSNSANPINRNDSNSKVDLSFCDEAVSTSDTESQQMEEDACIEVSAEACSESVYCSTDINNYRSDLPPTPPVTVEPDNNSVPQQDLPTQPAASEVQPSTSSKPQVHRGRGRPAVNVVNVVHKTPIVDLAAEAALQRKKMQKLQQQKQFDGQTVRPKAPAPAPISWDVPNSRYYRKLTDDKPADMVGEVGIRTLTAAVDQTVPLPSHQPTPAQPKQQSSQPQHPLVHLSKLALQLPVQAGPSLVSAVNGGTTPEPSTTPLLPSPTALATAVVSSNTVSAKPSLLRSHQRRQAVTSVAAPKEIDFEGFLAQQAEDPQQRNKQTAEAEQPASEIQGSSAVPSVAGESNSRRKRKCDRPMRIVASSPPHPPQPAQASPDKVVEDSDPGHHTVDPDTSITINFNVVPPLTDSQQSSLSAQDFSNLPVPATTNAPRQNQLDYQQNPIQVVQVSSADLLNSRRAESANPRARFQPTDKPLSADPKLYHPFRRKQQAAQEQIKQDQPRKEPPSKPEKEETIKAQPPAPAVTAVAPLPSVITTTKAAVPIPAISNSRSRGPLYRKLHDDISPNIFKAFVALNSSQATVTAAKRAKENGNSSNSSASSTSGPTTKKVARLDSSSGALTSSASTDQSGSKAASAAATSSSASSPAKKSNVRTRSVLLAAAAEESSSPSSSSGPRTRVSVGRVSVR